MADGMDKKTGKWLTATLEEKLKNVLIPMVPACVETYHLTLTTIIWSVLIIVFSFMSRYNIHWMWLTSLMIVLQYITDLLDGAIGRKRDTGLIKWGYYMDHFLDYIFLCAILIGYACLIPQQYKYLLFYILAFFGAFMVNSFLSFSATGKFKISYLGIGPTEIRLIFIVVNTMLIIFDKAHMVPILPGLLLASTFGLFFTVYRTQKEIWALDMDVKAGNTGDSPTAPIPGSKRKHAKEVISEVKGWNWTSMLRNIGLSYGLIAAAFAILMLRVGAPYHRAIAIGIYLFSWIPFVLSFTDKRAFLRAQKERTKRYVRPYVAHLLLVVVLVFLGRWMYVLTPVEATILTELSNRELNEHIATDLENIEILKHNTRELLKWASTSQLLTKPAAEITGTEREYLRGFWRTFLETSTELNILAKKYKGFYQVDYVSRPRAHAEAYLIAFVAFAENYASSLSVVKLVGDNTFVTTVLDEADLGRGVPENSFTDLKVRLTHPDHLLRLNAATLYLPHVKKNLSPREELVDSVEAQVKGIYLLLGQSPAMLISNPIDFFEKKAFHVWLPFQREVAVQMSNIRTVKRGYFITVPMINEHRSKLEPGDVLLERRNWHMTNVGIPGFWPHAAMHVGTLSEMEAYFKDLPALKGKTVEEYLRANYPEVLKTFRMLDEYGFERSVIESIRPGVVLTSLEHSGNADYLGVIRPKASKDGKWTAICRSFSYFGRPYDFNFDFMTDAALVCSELVYKSYHGIEGLTLGPIVVNGRLLLPPNRIAEKFDKEYGTEDQQFDFVLFLDGNEDQQTVDVGDAESLRASWRRPKWDVMQE